MIHRRCSECVSSRRHDRNERRQELGTQMLGDDRTEIRFKGTSGLFLLARHRPRHVLAAKKVRLDEREAIVARGQPGQQLREPHSREACRDRRKRRALRTRHIRLGVEHVPLRRAAPEPHEDDLASLTRRRLDWV